MPWDEAKFDRFVTDTIRMARGGLPGYGYPHVVFPYPPKEELACIGELRSLPGRLRQAGLTAELVPVAPHVARAAARFARRELHEAADYTRLQSDLAEPRGGLVARTAEICAGELKPRLAADIVLIVCRLGALYPFGHVSAFLDALYRAGITNTLAVAYPGTAEGTLLRFLGLLDPTGGYRGHVVT